MNKTSLLKRFVIKFTLAFVILLIVDLSFEFNLQEASSATFSLQSFLTNLVIAAVLGGFFAYQEEKKKKV